MKTLIALVLLAMSSSVFAEPDWHGHGTSTDNRVNNSVRDDSISVTDTDKSTSVVNTKVKFDTAAASASNLTLAYCSDGSAAQAEDWGISSGQVNYICEAVASLKVSLMLVDMELAAHDGAHSSENKRHHANAAHRYMEQSEAIMTDVVNYIDGRANTAGISAAAKDLSFPAILIGLLIWLL